MKTIIFFFIATAMISQLAIAEDMYVTDRVLLGLHQTAQEESLLVESLASGSKVEILQQQGSFNQVKTAQGNVGWIKKDFLLKDKPALLQLTDLQLQHEKLKQQLTELSNKSSKREKDLQIREDQVANAKTTIRELKQNLKQLEKAASTASASEQKNTDNSQQLQLQAANTEIKSLKETIEQLQNKLAQVIAKPANVISSTDSSAQLEQQINTLKMRIQVAKASLNGEDLPTLEDLAVIPPQFPLWYWVVLATMMLVGFVVGILWFDHMHRKKHGGFRL